jgi:hypothetical protein
MPPAYNRHIRVRCRASQSARGRRWRRRRWCCRGRKWRSGGGRCGRFGRLWLLRPHRLARRTRRWAGGPEFGDHRVGIDRDGVGTGEIAGGADHPDWNRHRLELWQREGDGETRLGGGHGDRTRGFAARSDRSSGVSPRWDRFQLDLHRRWRRFEGIQGKRGTSGQACPGDGNRDDTTHDQSLYCGKQPQSPIADHRSVGTGLQRPGADSLKDG